MNNPVKIKELLNLPESEEAVKKEYQEEKCKEEKQEKEEG
jgi:hypothetical protein